MERITNNEKSESIRSNDKLLALIDGAIDETIEVFGAEMSTRDQQCFENVRADSADLPIHKIAYLTQNTLPVGVSENYREYIRQILQTLEQLPTTAEKKEFTTAFLGRTIFETY